MVGCGANASTWCPRQWHAARLIPLYTGDGQMERDHAAGILHLARRASWRRYVALWTHWSATCSPTRILRRDGVTLDSRVWSLQASLPLVPDQHNAPCSDFPQLRRAVEGGHRRQESLSSLFHPVGCSIPWCPPAQARATLGRFSHVLFVGDSMLASVAEGLQLLVSGDLATGMLVPNASSEARRLCTCDGQMSMALLCRSYSQLSPRLSWHPLADANTTFAFVGHNEKWLREQLPGARGRGMTRGQAFASLCSDDPRPRFVVLNGGMHVAFDPKAGMAQLIDAALGMLARAVHSCAHLAGRSLVHVVWTGIHAMVDEAVMRKYPRQTWNASVRFDEATGAHAAHAWGVRSLFLTSLTRGASTIDGVHPLTDSALAAALIVVQAMHLAADGGKALLL